MIDKSVTRVYTVVINSKGAVGFFPAASFFVICWIKANCRSKLAFQVSFK